MSPHLAAVFRKGGSGGGGARDARLRKEQGDDLEDPVNPRPDRLPTEANAPSGTRALRYGNVLPPPQGSEASTHGRLSGERRQLREPTRLRIENL
jgi:hypothetical protein